MSDKDVPDSHPRAVSLRIRNNIVKGVELGITSEHGLLAHGRGEAFDYLIGEQTQKFAKESMKAAAAMLLLADHPVLSINGNFAALCPDEIVELAETIPAKIETNIFHSPLKRKELIADFLKKHGVKEVLGVGGAASEEIKLIDSQRRLVDPEGIFKADVIFVPLEDGDRCEALRKLGRDVITVDLNPMSRTSETASITIIDNIVRVMPLLIEQVKKLREVDKDKLKVIIDSYDNNKILKEAMGFIKNRMEDLSR